MRGGLRRGIVAIVVAGEAAVPLGSVAIDVRQGEVAAHPQVPVRVGLERPGACLAAREELEGRPVEVLAGRRVPRSDPLDLVDTRPVFVDGPVVLVLVRAVRAVARAINDALGGDGGGLQVAAVAHGHRARGAQVGAGVVAKEGMLGAADEHSVASGGDGLLVLAGTHGRGLEVEGRVQGGAGLRGELGGIPGALGSVGSGEVPTSVEGAVSLGDRDGLHGPRQLGIPAAVGTPGQGDAGRVAPVHAGASAAAQVREHAAEVDVAVVVVDGAHAHRAAAQGVLDAEVPRRVDLPGRRVDDDGADVSLAVDAREVASREKAAVGKGEEGLDLGIEVESLAGEVAAVDVEGGQAARGNLRAVLALLDAREVASDVHGGSDLSKGLDLDVALRVGAVDVTADAPRGLGSVVGHRSGHGGLSHALVRDAREIGRVGGDARTHVCLGVGEDRLPTLVEEGTRGGDVATPARGAGTVAPADHPARTGRGVRLDRVPRLVVAGGVPYVARYPGTIIERDVHRVTHLEGPHKVGHLRELQVNLLIGAARGIPRPQDPHTIRLALDVLVVQQLIDGVVGVLHDIECRGIALAGRQLRGVTLAAAPGLPALAPTPDEHPATAIRRLITEELGGGIHRGRLQPVGSILCGRILLLNVPAGSCGGRLGEAVMRDGLTNHLLRSSAGFGVSNRGEREGGTGDNGRACNDCKARKRGSHDMTFRQGTNLLHK